MLKLLHTLGAIGMGGALGAMLVLLSQIPEPASLAEYAALRRAMGAVAEWLLLPALGLTLFSGLLAMAFGRQFHNAGWAWIKLALGVLSFEGTLLTVQGPAQREALLSAAALAGEIDAAALGTAVDSEWTSLWVILALVLVNVVLGIWRPSTRRPVGAGGGTDPAVAGKL